MKSIFPKIIAMLALCALAVAAPAQGLYKWVDKDGRITYSDTPPPKDAKKVENKRLGDNVVEQDKLPFALRKVVEASPITLYANNCDPCKDARAYLLKRGVPFTEKNPETDPDAAKKMKDGLKSQTVPTLTVGSDTKIGFSDVSWGEAIDAAGYPKNLPKAVTRQFEPKPDAGKTDAKAGNTNSGTKTEAPKATPPAKSNADK